MKTEPTTFDLTETEKDAITFALEDWESELKETIKLCIENHGTGVKEHFAPGTHGYHEAIDRLFTYSHSLEEYVQQHPAIAHHSIQTYRQINIALSLLYHAYTQLSNDQENALAPPSPSPPPLPLSPMAPFISPPQNDIIREDKDPRIDTRKGNP